ncbi:MAG: TetR/AcrR family transcriptional regulator [Treponema sp.]|jgi:TetR/AcrR family transcriptional regulator of autoinduction and epiphytic fitness|nr:TetR/AcrR family transcriptional regulator [Treponema sp.]
MPDTPKKRKKRDTSGKRQVILDGAVKVFTEQGFEAASMDTIAEVAGVSKRTVYNHFQSKEALFQTIVEDFLAEQADYRPIEYAKEKPLADQLREFALAELFLINDAGRRSLSKLLTATFLMDVEFGNIVRSHFEGHPAFIAWLQATQADGKIHFQSAELAAEIFYGLVEGCLTWNALMTDGESLKYIEPLLDELIVVFLSRYSC